MLGRNSPRPSAQDGFRRVRTSVSTGWTRPLHGRGHDPTCPAGAVRVSFAVPASALMIGPESARPSGLADAAFLRGPEDVKGTVFPESVDSCNARQNRHPRVLGGGYPTPRVPIFLRHAGNARGRGFSQTARGVSSEEGGEDHQGWPAEARASSRVSGRRRPCRLELADSASSMTLVPSQTVRLQRAW